MPSFSSFRDCRIHRRTWPHTARAVFTRAQSLVENPGFPPARKALSLAGLATVPVRVDSEGMDIEYGIHHAPDAAIALVTPGQQAPWGWHYHWNGATV